MTSVAPDYAGACITGLAPALVGNQPAPWMPEPVVEARAVVLLVLDGLGWNALERHPELLPVLGGMSGGRITTVAPSTTGCALTSITTGLAPSQHGIVGFRFRIDDSVLNVLGWLRADRRPPPDPFTIQRFDPFLGRRVPVVTKSEFRRTGFSEAHLRGLDFRGWSAVSSLVEHCRRLVTAGERFVYAYYPSVDNVAHSHGLLDGFYQAELAAADRLVGDLLSALPSDAALLVTSDHGQIHLEPDSWVALDDVDDLVSIYAGDARFRYLHARSGAAADLRKAAEELVGDQAWVLSRDELFEIGWLGPDPSPAARRRVGDVTLAARAPVGFVDPQLLQETKLRSAHGSVTPDEMWVPLLAGRGRG